MYRNMFQHTKDWIKQHAYYPIKQFLYVNSNYVHSDLKLKTPDKRFVIFAHSRSGSHLLVDLLNSHPDITCLTEHGMLYGFKNIKNTYKHIDGVSRRSKSPVFGGKINIRQIEKNSQPLQEVIKKMTAFDWQVIVLERKNLLEQVCSVQIAKKRRQYHDETAPTLDQLRLNIDIPLLHQRLKSKEALNHQVRELTTPYKPLYIYYEEDLIGVQNQQNAANRIFESLLLPKHKVNTKFVKTNSYQLADLIINYKEMVDSIKGGPYEKFL